jgi:hypothetical protein
MQEGRGAGRINNTDAEGAIDLGHGREGDGLSGGGGVMMDRVWRVGGRADRPEVNIGVTVPVRTRRRTKVESLFLQLSDGSSIDISEYGTEEEDSNSEDGDLSVLKHVYRDETWSTNFFTYDPKPRHFRGRMGTTKFFVYIPSILTFFELFWPFTVLRKIVIETNRYATHIIDAMGNTIGGCKWVKTSVVELKAL